MRRSIMCCLAWFSLALAVCAQRGAYTAPTDLDQMVSRAETILRGHVLSAKVEAHPQFSDLQTVAVTLKVDRVLKGAASSTYTFRQYIWDFRDSSDAAGYRRAEEVLLFLNPNSPYGLTSPVGMEQGRFRILRDAAGNASALNGHGNAGLFNGVTAKTTARNLALSTEARGMLGRTTGRVPLAALEETIQALAGAQK